MQVKGFKNINLLSKTQFDGISDLEAESLYAVYGSGAGFPSSNYDDLSLGASGTSYTAPANGYFYLNKVAGVADAYVSLQNSTAGGLGIVLHVPGTANTCRGAIWARKNDIIRIDYNASGTTNAFRFIYAEGE